MLGASRALSSSPYTQGLYSAASNETLATWASQPSPERRRRAIHRQALQDSDVVQVREGIHSEADVCLAHFDAHACANDAPRARA